MTTKEQLIMKKNPQIIDITHHIVSGEWYRMNVDYTYQGDTAEMVEFTYDYDLYASPAHILERDYNHMTAKELARELEI